MWASGPYKLREWVVGSHLMLDANPRYVLGRPKIDPIEVRFILDGNTVSASLLAGAVDTTLGVGLNLEQSLELRDQWREGTLAVAPVGYWLTVYPQFINTSPPIIADVRFRRALMQALDRQAMVETIMAGLVPVAHSLVKPGDPEDRETEGAVVRYQYDVRRAAQGIEELGYARGGAGAFRDQAGQRLGFEVRTNSNPAIHTKALFPVADYWQRLGLAAEPFLIPVQMSTDREYSAQFPGFYLLRQPVGPDYVDRFLSSEARLPENRFQGRNTARYMNSELDGLIERYTATIPLAPRMQLLSQIVHHVSDQLNTMGLFYDVGTTLVGNRVLNVPASNPTSNIQEWDVKD
jgi:peptide/nickel transport system substrate-binding protein